jgi:hypothetical protein
MLKQWLIVGTNLILELIIPKKFNFSEFNFLNACIRKIS